jgi:hypothetical protein
VIAICGTLQRMHAHPHGRIDPQAVDGPQPDAIRMMQSPGALDFEGG